MSKNIIRVYQFVHLLYDFKKKIVYHSFKSHIAIRGVKVCISCKSISLNFVYGGFQSALGSLTEGTLMQGTMKYVTAANCASYYTNYDTTFDKSMACAYNKGKVTMCSVSSNLL